LTSKSLLILPLVVLLAACGGAEPTTPEPTPLPFDLTWEHDEGTIIFHADTLETDWTAAERLNHIPDCTLYGNGRMVWVRPTPEGGRFPMAAVVEESTVRSILVAVVDSGFLDLSTPEESSGTMVSTITARFSGFDRTVAQSYQDAPSAIRELHTICDGFGIAGQPLMPQGAWLTVTPRVDLIDTAALWPVDAPRTLAELAAAGQAVWVQGDLFVVAWYIVQANPSYTAQEGQNQYTLVMQVPGLTADAPPVP